jgi:hypothetical protein
LVFPKLWVTTDTAKKLRILFIEKLIEKFNERESFNKWEDVVDLSVYEDNGLRMVGCRKIGICKNCKNKKEIRDTCEVCDGVGKKDENRVYKPVSVLPNENDYLNTIKNDYYVMLLETSIYNYSSFEETKLNKEINVELKSSSKKSKKGKSISEKNEQFSKIENFIKRNFKENYSKCSVKKVTQNENSFYVEIDDNYCMNVGRNHSSSNIYFQIRESGICQRCYCKKDSTDGRLHGKCKEYSSKEIPLSKTLKVLLFGNDFKKSKSIVTFNVRNYISHNSIDTHVVLNLLEHLLPIFGYVFEEVVVDYPILLLLRNMQWGIPIVVLLNEFITEYMNINQDLNSIQGVMFSGHMEDALIFVVPQLKVVLLLLVHLLDESRIIAHQGIKDGQVSIVVCYVRSRLNR